MIEAIYAIIKRDIRSFMRHKTRILSSVVRPLLWLFIVGSGFGSVLRVGGVYTYQTYLLPGLFGLTLLFGGMLSGLSTTLDHENGVIRMLMLAPFSHIWIVISRIISSALIALMQVLVLALVTLPFGYFHQVENLALLIPTLIMVAWMCSALGMLFAISSNGIENFAAIINFVIFPIFFLSGALYPLHHLPSLMHYAVLINPFTYCVDLLQHVVGLTKITQFNLATDILLVCGFSATFTLLTCWHFSRINIFEKQAKKST